MACNLPSAPGKCIPVPSGEDPTEDCKPEDPTSCGQDGFCNGRGACQMWSPKTTCTVASCLDGVETSDGYCDGIGKCQTGMIRKCGPNGCGRDGRCLPGCTVDTECPPGNVCNGGVCELPRGSG